MLIIVASSGKNMSFTGQSHLGLIAVQSILIGVVFVTVASVTRANRRHVAAALAGGAAGGAVNIPLDIVAYSLGLWRYPDVTAPVGPLLYYLVSGLGDGALALIAWWLTRRFGWRGPVVLVCGLAVYGPFRDSLVSAAVHLIEFRYSPLAVVADSLFEFVIPVLVAFAVLRALAGPSPP